MAPHSKVAKVPWKSTPEAVGLDPPDRLGGWQRWIPPDLDLYGVPGWMFFVSGSKKKRGSCLEPLNLELADRFVFTKVVRETFKKEDLFVPLMTFHHNTPSFKTAV